MRILVADDEVTSRMLLRGILEADGYSCVLAENGSQAWDILQQDDAPGLVLLDWVMPGLDGVDVCRRLRARPCSSGYTYVLMLTTKAERDDIESGYDAGVDDYLTKPIRADELQQRLRVARRIMEYEQQQRASRRQLESFANEMQQLAEARARQLVSADRLVTLGTLSAGVAHEINNPASFISGNVQMMAKGWEQIESLVQVDDGDQKARFMLTEFPAMIDGIHEGVTRITRIVDSLKRYARQMPATKRAFSLTDVFEAAQMICNHALKHHVTVVTEIPEDLPFVVGDAQQIEQILINCMTNSGQALEGQKNGRIVLSAERMPQAERIRISISDNGPGIPDSVVERIFDPFFTTKSEGRGTGLGLSVSKGIAESHGGELTVHNAPDGGAVFSFTLPVAAADEQARSETFDEGDLW